jgi:LysM repeat protein
LFALAASLCAVAWAQTPAPSLRTPEQSFVHYTVKPGDTFNQIAKQYLLPTADRAQILKTNNLSNENRISVGMSLRFARSDVQFRPATA